MTTPITSLNWQILTLPLPYITRIIFGSLSFTLIGKSNNEKQNNTRFEVDSVLMRLSLPGVDTVKSLNLFGSAQLRHSKVRYSKANNSLTAELDLVIFKGSWVRSWYRLCTRLHACSKSIYGSLFCLLCIFLILEPAVNIWERRRPEGKYTPWKGLPRSAERKKERAGRNKERERRVLE